MSIDREKILLYLWIGLSYLVLWVLSNMSGYLNENFLPFLLNNIWRLIYVSIINFFFFECVVPFVFQKRKWIVYNVFLGIICLFVFFLLWSYGLYGWRMLGKELAVYNTVLIEYDSVRHEIQSQMAYSMGSVFFFGIIRHFYNYVKLKQQTQKLLIEKKEAELNYLKSQTNPHFLFNTLNNIYSLARDKSDLAPESILRLSKILRFMLYETGSGYIAIEQELKIIGDYIELEKLRYDDTLQISFHYDVEDMKQSLPPLLLIPLVENAFKHGVAETRLHPFIDIHLSLKNRVLVFTVKNSAETVAADRPVKENIGLSNLRRQLELLYTVYDLSVKQENALFTASLTIKLASHV